MPPDDSNNSSWSADQILAVLWKRRVTWLAAFAVTFAAAALVTFSLPKVYSSVAYLWVTPQTQAGSDFEATQLSQVLTRSYAELLQTRTVADSVANKLPFEESGAAVQKSVKASPIAQSQLLSIEVEAGTPQRAQTIANTYAAVFRTQADLLSADRATSSRITIAAPATLPDQPSRPRPKIYLLIGALLAAFVAVLAALLRERFDRRLHVASTTTELLDLPVIGRIPDRAQSKLGAVVAGAGDHGQLRSTEESFRLLLANLAFVTMGKRPGTIAVVSADEREGKSITCLDLARAADELGIRVLLVDADLRRAGLTAQVNLRTRASLSNLLAKPQPIDRRAIKLPDGGIHVIPSGPIPPNPSALLNSLAEFNRKATDEFELVIYDTPPLSIGADASLIASVAEGAVLVVNARSSERRKVIQALDQLRRARATILGIVVNRVRDLANVSYYGDGLPAENDILTQPARKKRVRAAAVDSDSQRGREADSPPQPETRSTR